MIFLQLTLTKINLFLLILLSQCIQLKLFLNNLLIFFLSFENGRLAYLEYFEKNRSFKRHLGIDYHDIRKRFPRLF